MKHGKKPTYEQRKLIERWKLNAHDWLVCKDTSTELVLQHRNSDKTVKTLHKEYLK